ncbi:ferritin-like domain-containing protein [Mycena amicta]|nr:ferritin-like domain-containing protein [Mycena amicta]
MKFSLALAALSLANVALALPTKRRGVSDAHMLNFALNLEHLQGDFFKQAFSQFPQATFLDAGEPEWVYRRLAQMNDHDTTHATFLSTALTTAGVEAVARCEFTFSFDDPHSVIKQAAILKTITTAAYNGAVRVIDNRDYAAVVASMMAVEARQISWINSAALQSSPWDTAFQTALAPRQAFSMMRSYIKTCPAGNDALLGGLKQFPSLTLADVHPGKMTSVSFSAPDAPKRQLFAAFISGAASPLFVPLEEENTRFKVPEKVAGGFVFCVITSDGGRADDETTVAGPVLLEMPFSADV